MNNFDQSSSGINVETNIFLCTETGQPDFDENFHETEEFNVLVFNEKKVDYTTKAGQYRQLYKFLKDKDYYGERDLSKLTEDYVYTAFENFFEENLEEKYEACLEYGIKTNRDDYTVIETFGSNQGEMYNILVSPEYLKRRINKNYTMKDLQEEIDNYCWKIPQSVSVIVNDEEFYSPTMDGVYGGYDKKTLIDEVCEHFKNDIFHINVLADELDNILPDEITEVH